ncbi:unnamed protein product [Tuber aestivum]|uniref:Uncharacterized protein n=1 Tax=Tuber aestivum TaxID=59557 RepID=A0A292PM88_9PEZI|nr:unnamed protein product [Tuber aestivum]
MEGTRVQVFGRGVFSGNYGTPQTSSGAAYWYLSAELSVTFKTVHLCFQCILCARLQRAESPEPPCYRRRCPSTSLWRSWRLQEVAMRIPVPITGQGQANLDVEDGCHHR